jgi:hypothetical protein
MSLVPFVQTNSLLGYFILTWAATIMLLVHNAKRIGKVKFWVLASTPLVYFLSFYLSIYQITNPAGPVTLTISASLMLPILLYAYAGNVGGALIGISFRSISRSISQDSHIRDYMVLTAYGFIIFFTAGGATVSQAGYPPFGLANVSFVGLAAYLISTGIYQSAVSVAEDVKLRQSIKSSTVRESSKFLTSLGTAHMEKQIEEKVLKVTRDNAALLLEQSGVQPTLTEGEMKRYLTEVIEELKTRNINYY